MNKEQELVDYAQQQVKNLQEQIVKWQLFLAASNVPFTEVTNDNAITKAVEDKVEKKGRKVSTINNGTLKSHIIKFLKDSNTLHSGRDIFDYVVSAANYTGNYTSFAGKLSVLVSKKELAKVIIDDVPNDKKFWYGLEEWWEDNTLKASYKTKLDEKVNG